MIKFLFFIFILITSSWANSSVHYNIELKNNFYNLEMEFEYRNIPFQEIQYAYKNGKFLSNLSQNIESIEYSQISQNHFNQLMHVKSFGFKSKLLSHCTENQANNSWNRDCILDTTNYNGGDFMIDKSDHVTCIDVSRNNYEKLVKCSFIILGRTKPIKFLGIELVSDYKFAIKAKTQAMINFFKYYYLIKANSISFSVAEIDFANSKLNDSLLKFEKEALTHQSDKFFKYGYRLDE